MTQEEKNLLFQVLCTLYPYKVIVHVIYAEKKEDYDLEADYIEYRESEGVITLSDIDWLMNGAAEIKPYLRPFSTMTKKEQRELDEMNIFNEDMDFRPSDIDAIFASEVCLPYQDFKNLITWARAHHFDYNGMIEKNLALEAPKGMYK